MCFVDFDMEYVCEDGVRENHLDAGDEPWIRHRLRFPVKLVYGT